MTHTEDAVKIYICFAVTILLCIASFIQTAIIQYKQTIQQDVLNERKIFMEQTKETLSALNIRVSILERNK